MVISEAVDLGLGVETPHPSHMYIPPNKADSEVLGFGQVLQPGNEVVPFPMMLPYMSCYKNEVETVTEPLFIDSGQFHGSHLTAGAAKRDIQSHFRPGGIVP